MMDRAEWLEARRPNLGASEIAALFGVSPFETKYALWNRKKGLLSETPDDKMPEHVRWGQRLEDDIADWVAEKTGWRIAEAEYALHPTVARMAASLDREIHDAEGQDGPGALECKNVDSFTFRRLWLASEPPLYIQLQLQAQIAVKDWRWGCIAYLVGGNDPRMTIFQRHEPVIQKIEAAVADFWRSIDEDRPPAMDWLADTATVIALHQSVETGLVVSIDDDEAATLCALYEFAGATARKWEAAQKEAKARVLTRIGTAEMAIINSTSGNVFRVNAKEVAPAEVKAHTKKGYRGFRVKEERADGAAPVAIGSEAFKQLATLASAEAAPEDE